MNQEPRRSLSFAILAHRVGRMRSCAAHRSWRSRGRLCASRERPSLVTKAQVSAWLGRVIACSPNQKPVSVAAYFTLAPIVSHDLASIATGRA